MKRNTSPSEDTPKLSKFDYEKMKEAATSDDAAVRKAMFVEYFERFQEFPSYLFDNESQIDERLHQTVQDLIKDPETTKEMRKGIEVLVQRLSAQTH